MALCACLARARAACLPCRWLKTALRVGVGTRLPSATPPADASASAPCRVLQSVSRTSSQPACGGVLQVPSCLRTGGAQLTAQPGASWVLEPGPLAGLFYLRSDCASSTALYLGIAKGSCPGAVPSLSWRSGPASVFADLLWTLERVGTLPLLPAPPPPSPVSQPGTAQIDSVTVVTINRTFNNVRVLVRPVAGSGVHAAPLAM